MTLAQAQSDFREWLLSEDEHPSVPQTMASGLRVYQNTYRAQLVACLEETYERVRLWLGDEGVRAAAAAHIDLHPPTGWTLDAYGRDFPETLEELYPDDPEIAELAWLDVRLAEAFVAPDAEPMRADAIADVNWEHAVLMLSPTLVTGEAHTNASAIWSALANGGDPPAVVLLAQPTHILVWRQGLTSCFRQVDDAEHEALIAVQGGLSFGALCAQCVEVDGENAGVARAGAWLGQWLRDELIVGIAADKQPYLA